MYASTSGDATFLNPETDVDSFVRLAQSQDDQSSDQPDIDWVYVGEVQFYDAPSQPSASLTSKPGISIYIL